MCTKVITDVYQVYLTSAGMGKCSTEKKPTFIMPLDIPQGLQSNCHFGKHGEVPLPQSMKCCIVSERNCFFVANINT